jgi:hypothetical protein
LRQFTTILGVEFKPTLRQLGLRILARTAKFTVNGCFHNNPGYILVGSHRDFEDHIAVGPIHARNLEKRIRHAGHLKLSPVSWRVGSDEFVLRPTENRINPEFLRGNVGNRDVFLQMAEISEALLDRQAFTEVLGIRLQNTIFGTVAGGRKQSEQYHSAN